ncbi:hypothetical protein [Variovorax sp. GT1P44]|uniref:hypothetical protein n=1 Tax=Variovorax sp. GT1P44 TaxID=3443742 RepID=UPI003F4778C2
MAIPGTFTEAQAELIFLLAKVGTRDSDAAERLLESWTPTRFTEVQATCVRELLTLDPEELSATLVDAMESCELRHRLRVGQSPFSF